MCGCRIGFPLSETPKSFTETESLGFHHQVDCRSAAAAALAAPALFASAGSVDVDHGPATVRGMFAYRASPGWSWPRRWVPPTQQLIGQRR